MSAVIEEAYLLTPPHKPAGEDAVPGAAWKTHKVIYIYDSFVGPRISIRARSFALVLGATADGLVKANRARYESEDEARLAKANGHQREYGSPPKAKAPAKGKGKADGDSG